MQPEPSHFLPEPTKTKHSSVLFGGSNNCGSEEIINKSTTVVDYNNRSSKSHFWSLKLKRHTPEATKNNHKSVLFGGSNNCRWEEVLNKTITIVGYNGKSTEWVFFLV